MKVDITVGKLLEYILKSKIDGEITCREFDGTNWVEVDITAREVFYEKSIEIEQFATYEALLELANNIREDFLKFIRHFVDKEYDYYEEGIK